MKGENYGSPLSYTVRDETQAKLLSDPNSLAYFWPFLARTCTVSQAAEEVGCKLDTMLYRVRTFLRTGLLEVVDIEKRAGRPIKHYRSVHDAYFVPFSTTPFATFEEESRQFLRRYEDVIIKELARVQHSLGRRGFRLFRDARGEVTSHSASHESHALDYDKLPEHPYLPDHKSIPLAEIFTDELLLTDDEARALLSQLYTLWRDNKRPESETRSPYLLRVIMVPLK